MKVEKIEVLGVIVPNLEEAIKLFSDIFETEFLNLGEIGRGEPKSGELRKQGKVTEDYSLKELTRAKVALDKTGLLYLIEMIAPPLPVGFRNIHLKVSDYEQAKAEMERKGIRLEGEMVMGGLKEAVYRSDDCYGIQLCLCEYDAPSLVEAMLEGQDWKP